MSQWHAFVASMNEFLQQVAVFLPKLGAVLSMLVIGLFCAKFGSYLIRRLLKQIGFERVAANSGLEKFLKYGHEELTIISIVGHVVFWFIALFFFVAAINTIGFSEGAKLIMELFRFLPKVLVAIFMVVFGTILARVFHRLVFSWLHSMEFDGAMVVGTGVEYMIQTLVIFAVLEQLGVRVDMLISLFLILFGSVAFALALAFGLAGREWAASVIADIQKKVKDVQENS